MYFINLLNGLYKVSTPITMYDIKDWLYQAAQLKTFEMKITSVQRIIKPKHIPIMPTRQNSANFMMSDN